MNLSSYLNSAETVSNQVLFLIQLPLLYIQPRMQNRGVFTLDLFLPIRGKKTVLGFMWEKPQPFLPEWFAKMDLSSYEGKAFLDVGANLALFGAHFVNQSNGNAHCFEISPIINSLLEKNATTKKGMIIVGGGLSNESGKATYYSDHPYSMMGTLRSERYADKGFTSAGETNLFTLDEYMKKFPELTIGLIKIDVEGNEENVLKGGLKTIVKHKPVILFETNRPGDFEKCEKILKLLGYAFEPLDATNCRAVPTKTKPKPTTKKKRKPIAKKEVKPIARKPLIAIDPLSTLE